MHRYMMLQFAFLPLTVMSILSKGRVVTHWTSSKILSNNFQLFFQIFLFKFSPFACFIHNYFWLWEAGSFGTYEYLFLAG